MEAAWRSQGRLLGNLSTGEPASGLSSQVLLVVCGGWTAGFTGEGECEEAGLCVGGRSGFLF